MWEVYEHRRIDRRAPRLPALILKRHDRWKDVVRTSGPTGLRWIKGFHDEALRGNWKGHRSSRLGIQYRVIYRIVDREPRVEVIAIMAHDYRRK